MELHFARSESPVVNMSVWRGGRGERWVITPQTNTSRTGSSRFTSKSRKLL